MSSAATHDIGYYINYLAVHVKYPIEFNSTNNRMNNALMIVKYIMANVNLKLIIFILHNSWMYHICIIHSRF